MRPSLSWVGLVALFGRDADTAPVHELAAALLRLGPAVRWMRDPTRGGLATALNELAGQADVVVLNLRPSTLRRGRPRSLRLETPRPTS